VEPAPTPEAGHKRENGGGNPTKVAEFVAAQAAQQIQGIPTLCS
jgi:hypothetical protein